MCTLSWTRGKSSGGVGSYTLFFNRDEQRSRPAAISPRRFESNSRKWIAATDPQGGGTWLASNDRGLTVALLNSYESSSGEENQPGGTFRSRGLLVLDIIEHCAGTTSAMDRLYRDLREANYRPFYLAAIDLETESIRHWNGRSSSSLEPGGFLTSSSYQPDKVIRFRRKEFENRKDQESFHRQHDAGKSACSVLMSREDAATVSLSRVDVSIDRGVSYFYAEGPDWKWQDPLLLPLSQLSIP